MHTWRDGVVLHALALPKIDRQVERLRASLACDLVCGGEEAHGLLEAGCCVGQLQEGREREIGRGEVLSVCVVWVFFKEGKDLRV